MESPLDQAPEGFTTRQFIEASSRQTFPAKSNVRYQIAIDDYGQGKVATSMVMEIGLISLGLSDVLRGR
jgi:hypothetical protein